MKRLTGVVLGAILLGTEGGRKEGHQRTAPIPLAACRCHAPHHAALCHRTYGPGRKETVDELRTALQSSHEKQIAEHLSETLIS